MNLKKVLIVDDESELLDVMAEVVKRFNHEVICATGGIHALEILKKNKIDLVISDIRMPDGDGISLLKNIRQLDASSPQVIIITGHSDVTPDEAIAHGAQLVLEKPFARDELKAAIMKLLG